MRTPNTLAVANPNGTDSPAADGWPGYTYQAALAASERVNWRVEDLIGGDKRLDFSHPFLPESLARVQGLAFLAATEQRILNQIRGHAYLYTFGLVEEFIVPFLLDHVRPQLHEDDVRARAFLQFATEGSEAHPALPSLSAGLPPRFRHPVRTSSGRRKRSRRPCCPRTRCRWHWRSCRSSG
jgi:hypothetical protein